VIDQLQDQIRSAESQIDRSKRLEKELSERIAKLQASLNDESSQRLSLESSIRDMEYRHKREMEGVREEHQSSRNAYEMKIGILQAEISSYKLKTSSEIVPGDQTMPKRMASDAPRNKPLESANMRGGLLGKVYLSQIDEIFMSIFQVNRHLFLPRNRTNF
jgi:chromosome segregation ATPase